MRTIAVLLLAGIVSGCGSNDVPKPTYSELLTIYEAEQAELEREEKYLEDKLAEMDYLREELIANDATLAGLFAVKANPTETEVAAEKERVEKNEKLLDQMHAQRQELVASVSKRIEAQSARVEAARAAKDAARP